MRLLIKNGIVVSEELGGEKKADILIENDKIIKIAEQIDDENVGCLMWKDFMFFPALLICTAPYAIRDTKASRI